MDMVVAAGEEVGEDEEKDRRWRGRCLFICDDGVGPANAFRVHAVEPKDRQMEWSLEADRSVREAIIIDCADDAGSWGKSFLYARVVSSVVLAGGSEAIPLDIWNGLAKEK